MLREGFLGDYIGCCGSHLAKYKASTPSDTLLFQPLNLYKLLYCNLNKTVSITEQTTRSKRLLETHKAVKKYAHS